ncbi:MAG: hypothetical protein IK025_03955 [Bacteroidales bacterium]|nr:hypothetical protein [Bacteroidales bacterium]
MAKTSVPRNDKTVDFLRQKIRETSELQDKTLGPQDFGVLQKLVSQKVPGRPLNDKTLRRLFGYDKTDENSLVRLETLDILSQYVGFENWNDLLENFRLMSGEGSGDFVGEEICADNLAVGETVYIEWNPNRKSVLKYLGNQRFEIAETENSKWQVGDTFLCKHFILGMPLHVDNLTDKSGKIKSKGFVVGKMGGLTIVKQG